MIHHNLNKFVGLLVLPALMLLAACANGSAEPTANPEDEVILAAREFAAAELNLPVSDIQVESITKTDFPDSCLGASDPGEVCAQVLTPGYEVELSVNGEPVVVRTDLDAEQIRLVSGLSP